MLILHNYSYLHYVSFIRKNFVSCIQIRNFANSWFLNLMSMYTNLMNSIQTLCVQVL